MKKTFILFSILCLFASCKPSNRGIGGLADGDFVGEYTEEATLPPGDTSFYKEGCTQPGVMQAKPQVDPRLKMGASAGEFFRYKSGPDETDHRITYQDNVEAVSNDELEIKRVVSDAAGEFPPGSATTRICRRSGDDFTCDEKPLLKTGGSSGCAIAANPKPTEETKVTSGKFKLPKDKSKALRSWRVFVKTTGHVICGDKDIGTGTETVSIIRTNEVASMDPHFCGGTYVQMMDEIKLDQGKTAAALVDNLLFQN